MRKAYNKDIWRTIWRGKKRFLSIMLITTLGVAMFSALGVACMDLRQSADIFLDAQNLFDIQVVSTLGLTQEDVDALGALETVSQAEGVYSETVQIRCGEKSSSVSLKTLSGSGMNQPYLLEGSLPGQPDEIVVTRGFFDETGIGVGETVTVEEDLDEEEEPNFLYTEYKVAGVVTDPADLNNTQGAVSFRTSSMEEDTLFVLPEAVDSEVYTAVYLTLAGGREMFCYGDGYRTYVADTVHTIETEIKAQREQARYDEITGEAYEELAEAQREADEEFAKAEQELQDAAEELEAGKEELAAGERELEEAQREAAAGFADARVELEAGKEELASGPWQLEDAAKQITEGEWQLYLAKQTLTEKETEVYGQIETGQTELNAALAELIAQKGMLQEQIDAVAGIFAGAWPQSEWEAYVKAASEASAAGNVGELPEEQAFLSALSGATDLMKAGIDVQIGALDPTAPDYAAQAEALEAQKAQLDALPIQLVQLARGMGQVQAGEQQIAEQQTLLESQKAAAEQEFAAAWQQIADSEAELVYGKQQLEAGQGALAWNETQLADGETRLAEEEARVNSELAEGWQELADGRAELAEGETELAEGIAEYEEQKEEVQQELADAKKEIEEIDMTQWYVQDRTSLSGYANIESDADSIEAIGTVFPVVFFVVAILISLTTITRMVEEDRGLIGTYKALGFTDREIRRKYVRYALAASAFGSAGGTVCGFLVLPGIIFVIFGTMYVLPEYYFRFDMISGIAGPLVFMGGIVGATVVACEAELSHMPAVLMRPKAPCSGSRVLLERVTPVWRRLSFLNKVTARNLFRYKKRLFMTVTGIMGCMALLLFGFAIKDSVEDLMPRQYGEVYRYDVLAAASAEDNETLVSHVKDQDEVASFLNLQIETVKLKTENGEETVQLFVVPEDADFSSYIYLEDIEGGEVALADGEICVTRNASDVLGFAVGDSVQIRRMTLEQQETVVTAVVENYLGNSIYMTQGTYEEMFGAYEPNGVLLKLSGACSDQQAYAHELESREEVVSCMSTAELKAEFSQAFALMNMVVYIIIIMAACLAFVVLFTLSATNISERQRELATIKVLGFFDREVHLYVNKETVILTGVGILCGIPLGYVFAQSLTLILKIPSIYLAVSLHTESYFLAAGISFVFALAVNLIMNRSLDGIDPVEALKSVE